jgi:hypothetical protein
MPVRSVIVDSAGGLHAARFSRIAVGRMGKTWLHQAWLSPTLVSTSSVFKS